MGRVPTRDTPVIARVWVRYSVIILPALGLDSGPSSRGCGRPTAVLAAHLRTWLPDDLAAATSLRLRAGAARTSLTRTAQADRDPVLTTTPSADTPERPIPFTTFALPTPNILPLTTSPLLTVPYLH